MNSRYERSLFLVVVLMLLTLAGGCTGNTTRSAEESYLRTFQAANDTYESTMLAIGRAYRDGLIDDVQLEKLRGAGHIAESTLRTAKSALELWLIAKSDTAHLDTTLRDVTAALTELLRVWQEAQR
jgi:outer membrane protein TolC